jgi:hypothetical protein
MLSAEDLLAGSGLTFEVEIPAEVLSPAGAVTDDGGGRHVRLRPLTVHDLQLVSRAAKESDGLVATFMVHRALVEPAMTVAQVSAMHAGLAAFLLEQVNRISGISATNQQILAASESPLAKAAFVLAREFGWTPAQVSDLTLGQVLVHLQMLAGKAQT